MWKKQKLNLVRLFFGFARAKHDTRPAHSHLVLPVAGGTWAWTCLRCRSCSRCAHVSFSKSRCFDRWELLRRELLRNERKNETSNQWTCPKIRALNSKLVIKFLIKNRVRTIFLWKLKFYYVAIFLIHSKILELAAFWISQNHKKRNWMPFAGS